MGIEHFLLAQATGEGGPGAEQEAAEFAGRSHWVSLLSEVLPRALLAELGLSKMLLGSSGGDQFFVVLPSEFHTYAEAFLKAAAEDIEKLSTGQVHLIWSMTENLGDWSDVRKRLYEQLSRKQSTPAALREKQPVENAPAVPPPVEIPAEPVVEAEEAPVVVEPVEVEAPAPEAEPVIETPPPAPAPAIEGHLHAPEPPKATPVSAVPNLFEPFLLDAPADRTTYFSGELGFRLREADTAGWSPETPGQVHLGSGKHAWPLSAHQDGIALARHIALTEDGSSPASTANLAARAAGRRAWGMLRGDVDNFGIRLRRVQSIEEHIQLSILYKQFFAGELEVLCSMPEFWRKVTLLYSGGDDFAVYGAWDALILLAREIQRLFARFCDENLKEFPGPEGKTITMALAVAPDVHASLASMFEQAGRNLEVAKSADKDCFYLFGSTVEWKQLATASDLKDTMARLVKEFACSPQYLEELASFYREGARPLSERLTRRARREHTDRPWRYHRKIMIATDTGTRGAGRGREFEKLRNSLIGDLIGKSPAQVKLRPAGKVALEWAKLLTEV